MPTIQKLTNEQHKYKVDKTYQRPTDAWSTQDNQCLIDTILRGEPMPIFFVNYVSGEDIYYVVDGQQRLNAIMKFYKNELKLNRKFSGESRNGQTFNGENALSDEDRDAFLNYSLTFKILEDYDDERIRMIFSRLQRGKPLQLGERLNARPGSIVERMREIANHPFMQKSVGVYQGRYGVYPDAARILFYEKHGAKQSGSNELYDFFDRHADMPKSDSAYKNAVNVLNYLEKCFPADPGKYKYLEKHAWVVAVYTMVRDLKQFYSLVGQEREIQNFIRSFHAHVYSEDFRSSNRDYQRFYDNVRGGWSEKLIAIRCDILRRCFLKGHSIPELDDRRQISDEEKIAVFARQSTCTKCGYNFKDYKDAEYHHMELYSEGGESSISNIQALCSKCHDKVHGGGELVLPSEEEKDEID